MGTDLLNIYSNMAGGFCVGYGFASAINFFGCLQNITPLGSAIGVGSFMTVLGLADFTTHQISSLNWISVLLNEKKKIKKVVAEKETELGLIDKDNPKYTSLKEEISALCKNHEEIRTKLVPYIRICAVVAFAISYLTHNAAVTFVNRALTSTVIVTVANSLFISPITLIISTLLLTGTLIDNYQKRPLQPV